MTDLSYALMNSVQLSFNGLELSAYLDKCYDFIQDKQNMHEILDQKIVVSCLCSVHFLKLISDKVKLVTNDKKIRRAFMIRFGLLQNATTLEEFLQDYKNIYFCFSNKTLNDTV